MALTKDTGQDLHLGNRCSRRAFSWACKSFENRRNRPGEIMLQKHATFSNVLSFGDTRIGISSDGIGTKIEVAERCGIYNTLGFDLIAMTADDLVASGIEPVALSNILDVNRLCEDTVDQLMQGLCEAARTAQMVVTGGETAELGNRISGYGNGMHFNWCATALGIIPAHQKPVTGEQISEGDLIISLHEPGLRSNGFTLARGILQDRFGDSWHLYSVNNGETWGKRLLTPSRIYAPVLTELLGSGIPVHGIAHITGGGVPDNLGRILKISGFGAELDNLFQPAEFLLQLQEWGRISDSRAYHSWNMGNGMLLVVPKNKAEQAGSFLEKHKLDVRLAGRIVEHPGISIKSRALHKDRLHYEKSGK